MDMTDKPSQMDPAAGQMEDSTSRMDEVQMDDGTATGVSTSPRDDVPPATGDGDSPSNWGADTNPGWSDGEGYRGEGRPEGDGNAT